MFDCRFLNNPHWEADLRALDGRDPKVQDYVAADPLYAGFFEKVRDLVLFTLPAHLAEGKTHLAIGFGCTGGQHRSVTLAEKMGDSLAEAGWQVSKRHRELERRYQVSSLVRVEVSQNVGAGPDQQQPLRGGEN